MTADLLADQTMSRHHAMIVLTNRLTGLSERLALRLQETPDTAGLVARLALMEDATLGMFAEIGTWETRLSGGPEFDLTALNPKPEMTR